jgi:hypothetical protein
MIADHRFEELQSTLDSLLLQKKKSAAQPELLRTDGLPVYVGMLRAAAQ